MSYFNSQTEFPDDACEWDIVYSGSLCSPRAAKRPYITADFIFDRIFGHFFEFSVTFFFKTFLVANCVEIDFLFKNIFRSVFWIFGCIFHFRSFFWIFGHFFFEKIFFVANDVEFDLWSKNIFGHFFEFSVVFFIFGQFFEFSVTFFWKNIFCCKWCRIRFMVEKHFRSFFWIFGHFWKTFSLYVYRIWHRAAKRPYISLNSLSFTFNISFLSLQLTSSILYASRII